VNDPRLGGHASPRRWWGFASSGIRVGFFLQTTDRGEKKWLLKTIDKVEEELNETREELNILTFQWKNMWK
jgi:hypothetical protein